MGKLKDIQTKYLDQLSGKSQQAIFLQQQIQETLSEKVKNTLVFFN